MPIQYVDGHPTIAVDVANDRLKVNDATLEQKVNDLNTKIDALNTKIDTMQDGSYPVSTQLTGSYVEIGGVTFAVSGGDTLRNTAANKPNADAAHAAIPFCYYHAIDTGVIEVTDGTNWVVI
jgi:hypothetical protein